MPFEVSPPLFGTLLTCHEATPEAVLEYAAMSVAAPSWAYELAADCPVVAHGLLLWVAVRAMGASPPHAVRTKHSNANTPSPTTVAFMRRNRSLRHPGGNS
jgi:hypothetical protein